jgi:hypothetical protein
MSRYLVYLCACLPAMLIVAASLSQPNSSNDHSAAAWISDPHSGSNLLYIIPKDVIGDHLWGDPGLNGESAAPREAPADEGDQTIFYIRDFKPAAGEDPFYAFIDEDWIVVPVDAGQSLFRLIATHASGKEGPLPKLQLDKQYPMERQPVQHAWSAEHFPAKVLLAWAEWWQNETNATPVVLILMQF